MDSMKRDLSFNDLFERQSKILRIEFNHEFITCIEDLSSEIFYEIFDYLDGCQIYQAFSNLNYRFYQLLNSSSIRFKIQHSYSTSEDIFMNNWKSIITHHRQQILSIAFHSSPKTDEFFSLFNINSSFNHLESLVLYDIQSDILMPILNKSSSLPCLFSLTIIMYFIPINLTDIYQTVFNLSMLKYYKLRIDGVDTPMSLPIATKQQQSSIEHLVIDHYCTFQELTTIVSYTPQLRYLNYSDDYGNTEKISLVPSIRLENLIYLSLNMYNIEYHIFKEFIEQMNSKLKKLSITTYSEDILYLDGYRWEQLITKYFPQLEKFSLKYDECIDQDTIISNFPYRLNQFLSSFWIKRKWIFEVEIDCERIFYFIRPYRKRWYEDQDNHIVDFTKSTRLSIIELNTTDSNELLMKFFKRLLTISTIYHLEISDHITFDLLFKILKFFPELDSLNIFSILSNEKENIDVNDNLLSIVNNSKITKFYPEKVNFQQLSYLMLFSPSMIYLKLNYINTDDVNEYLRCILKNIEQYNGCQSLLSFHILAADDEIIEHLEKMINDEELLINYRFKRVIDQIFLYL